MDDPGGRRGRTHNAEGARQAILDAAEAVFAEHGFDGARVDAIAARSGYNKSLIFQYFGDKLSLYAAVIRNADNLTRPLQDRALSMLIRAENLDDYEYLKGMIREFFGDYFDYMVAHPNFMRILNWEMAEGFQIYSKVLTERDFQDVVDFAPALQKLVASGRLRSSFNPMVQLILSVFTTYLYLGMLPMIKIFMPDVDITSEEGLAQAREFIIGFVIHGLLADPSEAKSTPDT